ncbi:hypothetical protein SLA2020_046330 [Shorea laevis]
MIWFACSKCWNKEWHYRCKVQSHLIKNGFMDGYLIWKRHGEIIHRKRRCTQVGGSSSAAVTATNTMNDVPSADQLRDMLHDAMGPNFFNNENSTTPLFEEPRGDAKEFFDLL